ncbi:MAG TPA: glycoside hydrolase family 38 C-terminal domain-containing protein [Acidimicrobiales bacterium]|nr:glycoside hydrolase family 38 C-terminal domain-containing protein [Acidimicrobiales bacterium]
MARRVSIVPHTHWDREWYAPFQSFRLRLVDLLDSFLPAVEVDASYRHFLLDGQMAVVDDYLELRPEAAPLLRRLAASGRLAMGPWYTLPDEFLVSGETHIRNLQKGLETATSFGGAMNVGYLPDMFGHIAQMPQLLRQFGFEHAVVWRGVPASVDASAFWWSSPDGSTVRAEYMRHGYGNGASIPNDPDALIARIKAHDVELGDALRGRNGGDPVPMLWMNGTDHEVPQPWLGAVVADVNAKQSEFDLVVTSLEDHLAASPTVGLPTVAGELRSGARANLLMGVTSNRTDVRLAAARAERALERRAEPLAALFLPAERWPGGALDVAWGHLINNAAHDSVCACSADDVVDAVLVRYAEARHIADGIAARALKALADTVPTAGAVVVNPSSRTRGGLVEIELPGEDGPIDGAQLLDARPAVRGEMQLTGAQLGGVLGQIRSQQIDDDTYINAVDVEETPDGLTITLHADTRLRTNLLVEEIKRDLYARSGARPDMSVTVKIVQRPRRRVLVRVESVPGFGGRRWVPEESSVLPVSATETSMTNGLVKIDVDEDDGTFRLNGTPGFDRLIDDGDHGDTYNYSPPEHNSHVNSPIAVAVRQLEGGPLRARLEVRRRFEWAARIDDSKRARVGRRRVDVTTILELRAGERAIRVHTTFENTARDHRLRAQFPLPERADGSQAECAFTVVDRGLDAEGGPTERALPTFPARRFVQAGGLTVVHEAVTEYEVVSGGRALAITLLRATGMLSRVEMVYRPMPAGPPIPLRGSQMLGPVEAHYAVAVGDVNPYALVDDVFLPLEVVMAEGGGGGTESGQALLVDGAEVSAVRRVPGGLEVRIWNPSDQPCTAVIGGRGWTVDLRGRPLEAFDGSVPLGPWQIATCRVPQSASV